MYEAKLTTSSHQLESLNLIFTRSSIRNILCKNIRGKHIKKLIFVDT